jgi:hypothetical protein
MWGRSKLARVTGPGRFGQAPSREVVSAAPSSLAG